MSVAKLHNWAAGVGNESDIMTRLAKASQAHGLEVYSPFAEARDALRKLEEAFDQIKKLPSDVVDQVCKEGGYA